MLDPCNPIFPRILKTHYGLQTSGMNFQMKAGISLSKDYKLIHRFSEDIDLLYLLS
ncbi:MAG: nucleotidyl transferase AbiEii/AbiGii toxin family protein [Alphaproteobacteria bacterium]|nr:nucleotidyl transferase AbiEii/AbiGii toxin family protein [Alphaproteobacteria bacterium]